MKHHVYVATDDPYVVQQEIKELPHHVGNDPLTIMWNTCHEIKFYFTPENNSSSFHISDKGKKASCFDRYHRNIVSMVDFFILTKAKTVIVEYNSNWGRIIYTSRVRMNTTIVDFGNGTVKEYLSQAFPEDIRVGWGGNDPGMIGE